MEHKLFNLQTPTQILFNEEIERNFNSIIFKPSVNLSQKIFHNKHYTKKEEKEINDEYFTIKDRTTQFTVSLYKFIDSN